jgi:hypothetical protein
MEVKCIYCGQMNGNDALVCIGCGRTLPPSPALGDADATQSWGPPPEPPSQIWTPDAPPPWTPPPAPTPWAPPQAPPPTPQFGESAFGNLAPPWPGPPTWQAYADSYGQVPPEVTQAQSHAKTAMILGIVGVACCQIVLGPIALFFGLKSRATLLRYGIENGQGMATAGIVLGTIDILLGIMSFLAWLAN